MAFEIETMFFLQGVSFICLHILLAAEASLYSI